MCTLSCIFLPSSVYVGRRSISECKEHPAAFLSSLPFLCEDVPEPHIQYWKVERERVLGTFLTRQAGCARVTEVPESTGKMWGKWLAGNCRAGPFCVFGQGQGGVYKHLQRRGGVLRG